VTNAVVTRKLSVGRLLINVMFKLIVYALNHNNSVAICVVFKEFKQQG
jgi:hypothetical protein